MTTRDPAGLEHHAGEPPFASKVETESSYYLIAELPGLPKMMNSQGLSTNRFVLASLRKRWRTAVAKLVLQRKPRAPHKRARVRFTRFSSVCPDPDNLVAGFKPCLDGLVDGGILTNDKWDNVGMPEYTWVKAPQKAGKIRIEVWSIST